MLPLVLLTLTSLVTANPKPNAKPRKIKAGNNNRCAVSLFSLISLQRILSITMPSMERNMETIITTRTITTLNPIITKMETKKDPAEVTSHWYHHLHLLRHLHLPPPPPLKVSFLLFFLAFFCFLLGFDCCWCALLSFLTSFFLLLPPAHFSFISGCLLDRIDGSHCLQEQTWLLLGSGRRHRRILDARCRNVQGHQSWIDWGAWYHQF